MQFGQPNLGKAKQHQCADHPPAGVDLEPAMRQPRRRWCSVMVVVQTFAGGDQCQPLQIAGPIWIWTPSEVVSDGVDRRRASEIHVDVDEGRKQPDQRPENDDQDADTDSETEERVIVEPPVGARRLEVPAYRPSVSRLRASRRYSATLLRCTLNHPSSTGECGSPSTSVKAWCLRWTATH